jgi:hypothetical protein
MAIALGRVLPLTGRTTVVVAGGSMEAAISGEPPPETKALLDTVGGGAPRLRGALEAMRAIAEVASWEARHAARIERGPWRTGWGPCPRTDRAQRPEHNLYRTNFLALYPSAFPLTARHSTPRSRSIARKVSSVNQCLSR